MSNLQDIKTNRIRTDGRTMDWQILLITKDFVKFRVQNQHLQQGCIEKLLRCTTHFTTCSILAATPQITYSFAIINVQRKGLTRSKYIEWSNNISERLEVKIPQYHLALSNHVPHPTFIYGQGLIKSKCKDDKILYEKFLFNQISQFINFVSRHYRSTL